MMQPQLSLNESGGGLRLVQITDTHLGPAEGAAILNREGKPITAQDPDACLRQVLELALAQQPKIDLALGTGDIAAQGDADAYRRAGAAFARLRTPALWLPGNHDDRDAMARILGTLNMGGDGDAGDASDIGGAGETDGADGTGARLSRSARSEHWLILMLNSQIPGEVKGRLGEAELAILEAGLEAAARDSRHCLICLHHQPVPMGSAWIDRQMVEDHAEFWRIIDASRQVRGVLWGHVHQQLEQRRGNVLLMSTPSSWVQFAPGSAEFKYDTGAAPGSAAPPGYRWLALHASGEIETAVEWAPGQFTVHAEASGHH